MGWGCRGARIVLFGEIWGGSLEEAASDGCLKTQQRWGKHLRIGTSLKQRFGGKIYQGALGKVNIYDVEGRQICRALSFRWGGF